MVVMGQVLIEPIQASSSPRMRLVLEGPPSRTVTVDDGGMRRRSLSAR